MSGDADLDSRVRNLAQGLDRDVSRYLFAARLNYYTLQLAIAGSLAAGAAAAILGLWPSAVTKEVVGALAAASAALLAATQQFGFQRKANLHYRKVASLKALKRRLDYELPVPPTSDDVAAVSTAWSAAEHEMNQRWEDMQFGVGIKKIG